MKQSIKTITLKRLAGAAVFIVIFILAMIAYNFDQLTKATMVDKGQSVSKFIETGLTTHMRVSTHEEKEQYKKNIQNISDVEHLSIIRSKYVSDQFGLESHAERFNDPVIAKAFSEKKASFLDVNMGDKSMIRVTFPYVARKDQYINCTQCHNVEIGTTLGAVDFYIDVSDYKNQSMINLYILFAVLILVLIAIVVIIFKTIDRHIKNPLNLLMEETRKSYETHTAINLDRYESLELEDVAHKVNLFNEDVIKKNEELEDKNRELVALNKEIEQTQCEVLNILGNIAETKSKETAYHVQRVARYSYLLAKYYGLDEEECALVRSASPMHDIGKVGIDDAILKKPGPLTSDEYEVMKTHSDLGYEVFKDSERKMLRMAAIISHEHHERWDGNGYPQGLKGDEIHIFGRITAIADVFDALVSDRVYKKAWPMDEVTALFKEERGKHFDPDLVDIFLKYQDEFIEIKERLKDSS